MANVEIATLADDVWDEWVAKHSLGIGIEGMGMSLQSAVTFVHSTSGQVIHGYVGGLGPVGEQELLDSLREAQRLERLRPSDTPARRRAMAGAQIIAKVHACLQAVTNEQREEALAILDDDQWLPLVELHGLPDDAIRALRYARSQIARDDYPRLAPDWQAAEINLQFAAKLIREAGNGGG